MHGRALACAGRLLHGPFSAPTTGCMGAHRACASRCGPSAGRGIPGRGCRWDPSLRGLRACIRAYAAAPAGTRGALPLCYAAPSGAACGTGASRSPRAPGFARGRRAAARGEGGGTCRLPRDPWTRPRRGGGREGRKEGRKEGLPRSAALGPSAHTSRTLRAAGAARPLRRDGRARPSAPRASSYGCHAGLGLPAQTQSSPVPAHPVRAGMAAAAGRRPEPHPSLRLHCGLRGAARGQGAGAPIRFPAMLCEEEDEEDRPSRVAGAPIRFPAMLCPEPRPPPRRAGAADMGDARLRAGAAIWRGAKPGNRPCARAAARIRPETL